MSDEIEVVGNPQLARSLNNAKEQSTPTDLEKEREAVIQRMLIDNGQRNQRRELCTIAALLTWSPALRARMVERGHNINDLDTLLCATQEEMLQMRQVKPIGEKLMAVLSDLMPPADPLYNPENDDGDGENHEYEDLDPD